MRYWLIKLCVAIFVAVSVYIAIAYDQEWMADALWYLAFAAAAGVCIYIFAVVPISEWRRGHRRQVVPFFLFTIVVLLYVIASSGPRP